MSLAKIQDVRTTQVLAPIRRTLPPLRIGGMGLDLSPLVLFFGIAIDTANTGVGILDIEDRILG